MRPRAPILFLTALVLARPAPSPGGSAGLRGPGRSPDSNMDGLTVHADSLELGLEVQEQARIGEPVRITFRAENMSGRTLDLSLRGRTIAFDVIVSDAEGVVVWRRLQDAVIPAILRIETLEPGGVLEVDDTWDQRTNAGDPVPSGTYTLRGELLTDASPLRTPETSLRIAPAP